MRLRDGLYRVDRFGLCAGLVIEGGKVVACAHVLRKRLAWWMRFARWVGP